MFSFDRQLLALAKWRLVPFGFLMVSDAVSGNNLDRTKPDATGRPKFADAFSPNFSQLTRLSNVALLVQRPGLSFIFFFN